MCRTIKVIKILFSREAEDVDIPLTLLAMFSTVLLPSLAVGVSSFLTRGLAWQTAEDCTRNDLSLVNAAMFEALDMAMYAKYRAADENFPRKGTSLQNFLGAIDEDDPKTLYLVQS